MAATRLEPLVKCYLRQSSKIWNYMCTRPGMYAGTAEELASMLQAELDALAILLGKKYQKLAYQFPADARWPAFRRSKIRNARIKLKSVFKQFVYEFEILTKMRRSTLSANYSGGDKRLKRILTTALKAIDSKDFTRLECSETYALQFLIAWERAQIAGSDEPALALLLWRVKCAIANPRIPSNWISFVSWNGEDPRPYLDPVSPESARIKDARRNRIIISMTHIRDGLLN